MKILYLVNCSNFFCSHFLELALAVKNKGHDVYIAAGNNIQQQKLEELGFTFIECQLSRSGRSILTELRSLISIFKLIGKVKPDLLHMFTIKPILYGCISNKFHFGKGATKLVASITGLGSSSLSINYIDKMLWFFIQCAYKFSFASESVKVVFENPDDMYQFSHTGLASANRCFLVNGAGVNTELFSPTLVKSDLFSVILVARLLKDKGVVEYIESGKIIKQLNMPIRLLLVGSVDPNNPSSMTINEIEDAHNNGYIEYLGFRDDIANLYNESHVACLPSYREGLPKSLIEAASCGLPIVTTDVPGCRQLINENKNGLLIPPQDPKALSESFIYLYQNKEHRDLMGFESRALAETIFDHDKVICSFLNIYDFEGSVAYEE